MHQIRLKRGLAVGIVIFFGALGYALPTQSQDVFSRRERRIITDFYNGGRSAGWIEAACFFAETGYINDAKALAVIESFSDKPDPWRITKWRLTTGENDLYAPCLKKIQSIPSN